MDPRATPLHAKAVSLALDIVNGRHFLSPAVPLLLWLFDAALCSLVIWKVPYTEIDWVAYMEQVSQFVSGERDYAMIKGSTGPLVYPAAHLYTYTGLFYLTNEGRDILLAQQIFAVLYMATLALVMACYWQAKAPPYILPLLVLSKRLHSVFVLRCFNDCFATFFLWLAIFCLQRRQWTMGSVAYSWGLGIKMSLLLVLPAVGVVLFLGRGFTGSLHLAWLMAQVQIAIGIPFFAKNAAGYLGRAFELTRQFKYEWTVNMRMIPEDIFLSRWLSILLLACHAGDLFSFISFKWLEPARKPLSAMAPAFLQGKSPFTRKEELAVSQRVTARYVLATILTANTIGLLFARSLHYQFYAYLAWSTPFLLWHAGLHPVLIYAVWGLQEWAWNVFPSTPLSSTVVVLTLLFTERAAWIARRATSESPEVYGVSEKAE